MEFKELKKRRGMFTIARFVIEQESEAVIEAFKGLLVVEATMHYMSDAIEYHAFSEKFDAIDDGEVTPEYNIAVDSNEDGGVDSITFIRVERGVPYVG